MMEFYNEPPQKHCKKPFKKLTIRENEALALWSSDGNCRVIEGPRSKLVFYGKSYQRLSRFYASDSEYLKVTFHDGHIEHVPGPTAMFLEPHRHRTINLEEAWTIDASHVLVVYRKNSDTSTVDRRIVRGPALFIPLPNEFLHSFRWHGDDPKDKTRKIPNALQFRRLRFGPESSTFYNVRDVRTKDDAMITVKVMIFYQLVDVEKMLDSTTDVIGDIIADVCADVVSFAAKLTYEEFLQKTDALSSLDTYNQLKQRADRMGYQLKKVVFRGYHVSDSLQAMHDDAIEKRTMMHIALESAKQEQELQNLTLQMNSDRVEKEHMLDEAKHAHKMAMEAREADAANARKMKNHELDEIIRKAQISSQVDQETQLSRVKSNYYATLHEMGVDVTKVLVAEGVSKMMHLDISSEGREVDGVHVHVDGADA
ncbi:hypothetical protein J8273_4837 [Carpediemonas membranifera]|uniref:Band 7 domain-containing protein n=1 Tax=Carpediemonas membranifera TaxID=201153 RepID=A0A8J6ATI0_9EUKA|nr:hypothetical protein J8273_4837 [Carpediemonas membranifera]|eukprot:KAG9393718.1 hypothetical protein J8273_4837 [Carpediemonas membranifera]